MSGKAASRAALLKTESQVRDPGWGALSTLYIKCRGSDTRAASDAQSAPREATAKNNALGGPRLRSSRKRREETLSRPRETMWETLESLRETMRGTLESLL